MFKFTVNIKSNDQHFKNSIIAYRSSLENQNFSSAIMRLKSAIMTCDDINLVHEFTDKEHSFLTLACLWEQEDDVKLIISKLGENDKIDLIPVVANSVVGLKIKNLLEEKNIAFSFVTCDEEWRTKSFEDDYSTSKRHSNLSISTLASNISIIDEDMIHVEKLSTWPKIEKFSNWQEMKIIENYKNTNQRNIF